MRLRAYQWGELVGVLFLLASTATQIFYVDPVKREIEWRLAAFTMQQNGQVLAEAVFDNRLSLLTALKAGQAEIDKAKAERARIVEKYKTADANVANYVLEKEWVENALQVIVVVLFAIGSLLAGFGRAMEMIAARRLE
ncbi:MAG: hypothetical protein R3D44_04190 [Hyphomicrobiaceae bacterium]